MADLTYPFLSGYDIRLYEMQPDVLERGDSYFPLVNSNNLQAYKDAGVQAIAQAASDLVLDHFIDIAGNKMRANSQAVATHAGMVPTVADDVATVLIENSRDVQLTTSKALQNIYDAVVKRGLRSLMDIGVFNLPNAIPPTSLGIAAITPNTTITTVPPVPPKFPGYGSDSLRYGGFGTQTREGTATSSLLGLFFDTFVNTMNGTVALLHSGPSVAAGIPITAPDVAKYVP